MDIILVAISDYSIGGYWCLSMDIILMAIGGYSIGGYSIGDIGAYQWILY